MKALKLHVTIGRDRRIVLDLPDSVSEGAAEIVLLMPESPENGHPRLEDHVARLMAHPRGRTTEEIDSDLRAERESWD
jgi:hypothetical protein